VSDVHVDAFLESRDVTFFENIFSMKILYGMSSLPANLDHVEDIPESIQEEIDSVAHRWSKRPMTVKSFSDDFTIYLMDDTPKTIAEAFASPDEDD
jgi:hypothetical protein